MLVIFPFIATLLIGLAVGVVFFFVYFFVFLAQAFTWHAKVSPFSKNSAPLVFIPWLVWGLVCLGTWVLAALAIYAVGYFYMPNANVNGDAYLFLMKLAMAAGFVPGLGVVFGCVGAGFTDLILVVVWLEKKAAHKREQVLAKRAA